MLAALAALAICIYFAPSIVAVAREHHKCETVFLLNLMLGWTVVAWFGLAAWAWFGEAKLKLD